MFYVLLYVTVCPFYFAIILMGKRELVALLVCLLVSHNCGVALPRGGMVFLHFVIVVFPDHNHFFLLKERIRPPTFEKEHN